MLADITLPECDDDGYYIPFQCGAFVCHCMTQAGLYLSMFSSKRDQGQCYDQINHLLGGKRRPCITMYLPR